MLELRGKRLAGRVTATVAACALAAVALVLNGQADSDATLQAAGGPAARADAPATATIMIVNAGLNGWKFEQSNYDLAVGGELTVVNNTSVPHTVTSVAVGDHGPLFDVTVQPGVNQAKTIAAASTLRDGTFAFFCRFHRVMTSQLTVGAGGPVTTSPDFEQPLVQPPRLTGKHIRIVMKRADVRVLPHGPRTPMLTFGGTFPGPDHRPARRAGHAGHLRQQAAPGHAAGHGAPARGSPAGEVRRPARQPPDPARPTAHLRLPPARRRTSVAGGPSLLSRPPHGQDGAEQLVRPAGHVPDHRSARRQDRTAPREVRHPAGGHRAQLPRRRPAHQPVHGDERDGRDGRPGDRDPR